MVPDVSTPDLDRATVAGLRQALDEGALSSRALTEAHLARIERYNLVFGPVRCVDPTALDQADASDRARRAGGQRSPIEGIPVLIKDNINVAGLPTTGGALALEHSRPAADAPVISRLRDGRRGHPRQDQPVRAGQLPDQ